MTSVGGGARQDVSNGVGNEDEEELRFTISSIIPGFLTELIGLET